MSSGPVGRMKRTWGNDLWFSNKGSGFGSKTFPSLTSLPGVPLDLGPSRTSRTLKNHLRRSITHPALTELNVRPPQGGLVQRWDRKMGSSMDSYDPLWKIDTLGYSQRESYGWKECWEPRADSCVPVVWKASWRRWYLYHYPKEWMGVGMVRSERFQQVTKVRFKNIFQMFELPTVWVHGDRHLNLGVGQNPLRVGKAFINW